MKLLSKSDIKQVFSMEDAIEADKQAFILATQGKCDAPLRINISADKHQGNLLFMPAYVADMDTASIKIVNIYPENSKKGLSTSPAQVLLMDASTGYIVAMMDGTYITQLRTGAASGVAFQLLAREDAKIGALFGTGGQASSQLEAMLVARKLDEVRVYSRNASKLADFVTAMQEELQAYGAKIIAAASSDAAIDNADMIVCVTPATEPVFDAKKVKAGATISGVGSYQHHMQELDPHILTRASKVYFDLEEMVLAESGDITKPLAEGLISPKDFTGNIGDLLLGKIPGRENEDEIIVFKTVGVATQDLVTAKTIYDKAVEKNIGTDWA